MEPQSPRALKSVVSELDLRYPTPAILTSPFQLIVWENIGYLIDDQCRQLLFDQFAATIGLDPRLIAAASDGSLLEIAKRGGMRPETRVERWRAIARITLDDCGSDLDRALGAMSLGKARTLLKRFPVIGDPGADKILLFAGLATRPALESNGLRALARLGVFAEQGAYAASYRAGIEALGKAGGSDRGWLIKAFLLLRAHGQSLCRRSEPNCLVCPLDGICAHLPVAHL